MQEKANLKCPHCGGINKVEIPEGKCLPFHPCEKCGKMITLPKGSGTCCVICEYSDKKCPAHNP